MSLTVIKTYLTERDGSHSPFGSARKYSSGLLDRAEVAAESKHPTSSTKKKIRWVPKNESVRVAGRDIGGMVYVTDCKPDELEPDEDLCPCINTTMAVARRRKNYKIIRGYYTDHYCLITESLRAVYLDWLESGRKSDKFTFECIALYVGGLERRFFYDDPSFDEKREILDEIERLIKIYGEDEELAKFLRSFIKFADTVTFPNKVQPLIDNNVTRFPLSVALGLGRIVMSRQNIPADWALSWYLCNSEPRTSTVIYRCWQEFKALYRQVFNEKHPKGLYVEDQGKEICVPYHSYLLDDFCITFIFKNSRGEIVPDIISLTKPLKILKGIANKTNKLLSKYHDYVGKNPKERGSLNALRLLPQNLLKTCSYDEIDQLKDWAKGVITKNRGIVEIREFIHTTGGNVYVNPSLADHKRSADYLAMAGYGVVQDPRFTLRRTLFSLSVNLFPIEPTNKLSEQITDCYKNANLALATGFYVAEEIYKQKSSVYFDPEKFIGYFFELLEKVSLSAKQRLIANFENYIDSPPSMSILSKPLKGSKEEAKTLIRQFVSTIVISENVQEKHEFYRIGQVYSKIGVDSNLIWEDVVNDKKNINQILSKANPIENLNKSRERTVTLDGKKIKELVSETESVRKVLGKVFETTTNQAESKKVGRINNETLEIFKSLDPRFIPIIIELLTKDHLSFEDADNLANRQNVMWSGCLEAINEWAFENFDEELIEEYDGYIPNASAVVKLKRSIDAKTLA